MTLLGPYVFLSYAKEDRKIVVRIYNELVRMGIQVWFDEHLLNGGDDWDRQIRMAINDSKLVVFCLSKNSVLKTGYVQRELKMALTLTEMRPSGDVFIVPARLDSEVRPTIELGKYQYIDVFKRGGARKLAIQIARRMGLPEREINKITKVRNIRFKSKIINAVDADMISDAMFSKAILILFDSQRVAALTNGIWVDFNPKYLTNAMLERIKEKMPYDRVRPLIDPVNYRNQKNLVTNMELSDAVLVKLLSEKVGVYFNRKYYNWISIKYPYCKLYISEKNNALIVDGEGGPEFLVMPVVTPAP